MDWTTESEGRIVVNFIVSTLEIGSLGKTLLLNCKILEKVNHSIVAKMFNNSLSSLWPEGIKYDNVILCISDAVLFVVKAGKATRSFHSIIIHMTCIARAIHGVTEEIRGHFSNVDKSGANGKKYFLKHLPA